MISSLASTPQHWHSNGSLGRYLARCCLKIFYTAIEAYRTRSIPHLLRNRHTFSIEATDRANIRVLLTSRASAKFIVSLSQIASFFLRAPTDSFFFFVAKLTPCSEKCPSSSRERKYTYPYTREKRMSQLSTSFFVLARVCAR